MKSKDCEGRLKTTTQKLTELIVTQRMLEAPASNNQFSRKSGITVFG